MSSMIGILATIMVLAAGPGVTTGNAALGQDKPFAVGVLRLTPELTITDEALGGKDFFGSVSGLAVDGRGSIFVCDAKAKNVKKFDAAGKFLKYIGRAGQGPGEFNYPYEIAVVHDQLYVRDLFASRISWFDLEGTYISSVAIGRDQGGWRNFRALPDGRWIVETEFVDRANPGAAQEMRLSLHDPDFKFLRTFYRKAVRRNKFISEPIHTNVPIPFFAEAEWGMTPDGKIVVGFSGDYGIEILDPDKGKILDWTHRYQPVAVTKRDQDDYFAGLTSAVSSGSGSVSVSQGAPDYIVKNTEFPKTKPAFEDFAVDGSGNIWAFLWLQSPGAKRMIDIFDPKGKFLGQVRLEGAQKLAYVSLFRPGAVWMAITNEDGLARIVKYGISS